MDSQSAGLADKEMQRHLLLRLDAPLMSFGGDTVDNFGVVRDHPAQSMITGLIGNALGYERYESAALAKLQQRLVMGSLRLQEGKRIQDFQTAQLDGGDRGWTTSGRFEGRRGGADTYKSPHIRYRDADANAVVLVVLRLENTAEAPTLDDIKAAFDRPERPLFIGRKPFLPSTPLAVGWISAPNIATALELAITQITADNPPAAGNAPIDPKAVGLTLTVPSFRAQWPANEGERGNQRAQQLTDERDWIAGVHTGRRAVVQGYLRGHKEAQS